jgi:hypothetical protein
MFEDFFRFDMFNMEVIEKIKDIIKENLMKGVF